MSTYLLDYDSHLEKKSDDTDVELRAKSSTDSISEKSPPLGVPVSNERPRFFWNRRKNTAFDPDSIATQPSVFDNPLTIDLYRPPAHYENTHRFDPNARWTWREEEVDEHGLICLWI